MIEECRNNAEVNHKKEKEKNHSLLKFLILIVLIIVVDFGVDQLGGDIGYMIGSGLGAVRGVVNSLIDSFDNAEKGKEDGLSVRDTEVTIGNRIKASGKLEVMSAEVVLDNFFEIGDDYKRLTACYGELIYTVDLYNADITVDGCICDVKLPEPEVQLIKDNEKSIKLASSLKHSWSGTSENGYKAAANSECELVQNVEKSVLNYEELMDKAKKSSIDKVSFLVDSLSAKEVSVHVDFK